MAQVQTLVRSLDRFNCNQPNHYLLAFTLFNSNRWIRPLIHVFVVNVACVLLFLSSLCFSLIIKKSFKSNLVIIYVALNLCIAPTESKDVPNQALRSRDNLPLHPFI